MIMRVTLTHYLPESLVFSVAWDTCWGGALYLAGLLIRRAFILRQG